MGIAVVEPRQPSLLIGDVVPVRFRHERHGTGHRHDVIDALIAAPARSGPRRIG